MSKPDGGRAFPEPGVWDGNRDTVNPVGNVLAVDLTYCDSGVPWPDARWVADWVLSQQSA